MTADFILKAKDLSPDTLVMGIRDAEKICEPLDIDDREFIAIS